MSTKFDPKTYTISQIRAFEFLTDECPACSGSKYFCRECEAKVEQIYAELKRRESDDPEAYALECETAVSQEAS